ncbi:MAG: hypothetical protein QOK14_917 [Frankiaceae bacterium]|nr:hypothetical protein [Frankiaceae bacterium]
MTSLPARGCAALLSAVAVAAGVAVVTTAPANAASLGKLVITPAAGTAGNGTIADGGSLITVKSATGCPAAADAFYVTISGGAFTALGRPTYVVGKRTLADAGSFGPADAVSTPLSQVLSETARDAGVALAKGVYTLTLSCVSGIGSTNVGGFAGVFTMLDATHFKVGTVVTPAISLRVLPRVSGTFKVGKTLIVSVGTWRPTTVRVTYTWRRDGRAIRGAVKSKYVLTKADKGHKVSVTLTATKTGYKALAYTSAAKKVA